MSAPVPIHPNSVPPQNLEAEESVLGAMMMSPNAITKVIDILEPGDFYRDSHGRIFRAACDLYSQSKDVDAITLIDELERRGELEGIGGKVRVHEIANLVPASSNAGHYAEIVRAKATDRGLIEAGMRIAQLGWDGGENLVERAEELVLELAPRRAKHDTVFDATAVVEGFREKVRQAKVIETRGIDTPFEFLGKLRPSRLYVLAGYTSDGKTAAGTQFAATACGAGERVTLVTNEMSEPDLTARLVAQHGIPYHMCESGQVDAAHKDKVDAALAKIEGWDIRIVDDESINLNGLRRHVRMQQPNLLIIDHLHRFHWKERRDLELTVRGINNLAREYEIPVLLLAQLKRVGDWKDPFPRPNLTQLRETAILEQEAWAVWFIWRKRNEMFEPGELTEFLTAKDRSGALGWKNLTFVPQYVRFDERHQTGGPND